MPMLNRAILAALLLCLPRAAGAAPADAGHWAADPNTHCGLYDATLRPGDTVSWIGACKDGRGEGPGTASFFNNGTEFESFTGNFSGGVAADGHVTVRWGEGWSYEGDMAAGHFEGHGVLVNDKKDRFEGQWKDGKLNGTGSVVHENGERYDGAWKDDLPNGHGILIRADGSKLEGEFLDGKYSGPSSAASTPAMGAAATPVSLDSNAASEPVKPSAPPSALESLSGKKLLAVDGAALNLTAIEGGIERDITASNGALEKTTFTFINDRLGTVAADGGTAAANVTGFFRLTDNGVEVRYADGRGEFLSAGNDGGVLLRLETPGAPAVCRSFYPEGHGFSDAEKKAAVAEYASRLGVGTPADAKASCPGDVAETAPPATPQARPAKPEHHAEERRVLLAHPAKFTPTSLKDKVGALDSVEVKDSVVHAIDAMPMAALPVTGGDALAIAAPAAGSALPGQHDALHCLTVESDGTHWGFRNACRFDVQFAYCLSQGGDNLTACDAGGALGSVSAGSFGALLADKSFSEKDAEHDFRWLACDGGAGEVVAHLDRIDPPSGRCVRAGDLAREDGAGNEGNSK
jgi:hypothetical protein